MFEIEIKKSLFRINDRIQSLQSLARNGTAHARHT